MINKDTYLVIMAGGVGSRFWPYSRSYRPKQFLDVLDSGYSLIQLTNNRFKNICPQENVYVVTNDIYVDLVKEHLPELSDDQILSEPVGRNTAPCIAYASYKIASRNKNANIIVSPSDHTVFKEREFEEVVLTAVDAVAKSDKIVTIGIKPSRPETGYGYIQFIPETGGEIKKVKTFTEKPELELAQKFLDSGEFVWNAGVFIWNAKTIRSAFEQHLPDMAELFAPGDAIFYTSEEQAFIRNVYSQCKNISIDYGVMEKAANVYVVQANFGWSDIGSWATLHDLKRKDEDNNVFEANILAYNTRNSIVKGASDKLIIVQGLDGYLVADIDNVLLICEKDNERQFRDFAADIKARKMTEYL
ncbi:MAG: mannose-1-phosphate guanylyltransferase [Cyclobacteriaceae bacterium]|nr:MAG: mannose-1-phosphate guanylyltransferase [Cyclobacteriaceae bacterium]